MTEKTPLWTAEEAIGATRGKAFGASGWRAGGVSIDTRTLEKGDLFIALTGTNGDGHAHLEAAFERGAAAALVSDPARAKAASGPCLLVDDTQKGMEALGAAARERAPARRVAVTGSVGKTGTKEMLREVLSVQGRTHASVASYNNLWGVPLTLARMPADTEYGIFEIGMNHAGEITPLTAQVLPHTAIITTVAPVHLEFFDSVAGIADAKAEILTGLRLGGTAILNRDNEFFPRLLKAAQARAGVSVIAFGEAEEADARLLTYAAGPDEAQVTANICGRNVAFALQLTGKHQALNAVAALAAVASLGADVERAAAALGRAQPVAGRGTVSDLIIGGSKITVIDESYNANPASMEAAISALAARRPRGRGRRIAVLGDMLELGKDAPRLHAELSRMIEQANIDCVYLSGPLMQHLWQRLPATRQGAYAPTADKLIDSVLSALNDGDIVMIKGSLGSRMGTVLSALSRASEQGGDQIAGQTASRSGSNRGRSTA